MAIKVFISKDKKQFKANMHCHSTISDGKLTPEELKEAYKKGDKDNIHEELGDLLFSVVNVSRFVKVDSEEALTNSTDKFIDRFSKVEKMAQEQGMDMKNTDLATLDKLWDMAKKD